MICKPGDPVLIDISSKEKAAESTQTLLQLDSIEEVEAFLADSHAMEKFLNDWKPFSLTPASFRVCHFTTSGNGCADITKYGLLPLVDALRGNTELSKFVNDEFGFRLSGSGKEYACFHYGNKLEPTVDIDLFNKLDNDNCISGYLYCPNGTDDEYDIRPEFIANLTKSSMGVGHGNAVEDWRKSKETFCVCFDVPYLYVSQISNIGLLFPEEENSMREAKVELLKLMARVAKGEQEIPVQVALTKGYAVPSNDCSICRYEK